MIEWRKKDMAENMQMPKSFFTDVYCLLAYLLDYELDDKTKTLCGSLERQLNAKLEAIDRRASFTSYKISLTGSMHREAARRKYISRAGIPSRYISRDEIHL